MCATILMIFWMWRSLFTVSLLPQRIANICSYRCRCVSFLRFGSLRIQYIRAFYLCPIDCVTFHFEPIGLCSERESCRNILNGNAHAHTRKKIIMKKKDNNIKAKAATITTVSTNEREKSDWNAHEYAHIFNVVERFMMGIINQLKFIHRSQHNYKKANN